MWTVLLAQAVAWSDVAAGKTPLHVRFDAGRSKGDRLSYAWTIEGKAVSSEPRFTHVFVKPGPSRVELKVRDARGAESADQLSIWAGNARPRVAILEPEDGSFFYPEEPLKMRVSVQDEEDGKIDPSRVRLILEPRMRQDPATDLIRSRGCLNCHTERDRHAGPSFDEVADRYKNERGAGERLAAKILQGGDGVWGTVFMPPTPQTAPDEARRMAQWILASLARPKEEKLAGWEGVFRPTEVAAIALSASYTDNAQGIAPALTGIATHVLHNRIQPPDLACLKRVRLKDVAEVAGLLRGTVEIRLDAPDGELLGRLSGGDALSNVSTPVRDPGGIRDLFFVARGVVEMRGYEFRKKQ